MKANIEIEQFIQELYRSYHTGIISYGYNPVSETYIVQVENDSLMKDDCFLKKVFVFTHNQAKAGEWVMFVSPSDTINFGDYHPVVREYANTQTPLAIENWVSELVKAKAGWSNTAFRQSSNKVPHTSKACAENNYAFAA